MKPRILFILHFPPPVHGSAMVGKYIRESEMINSEFDADFINPSTSTNISDDMGKWRMKKVYKLFQIQIKILKALMSKKYDLCYFTLTSNGPGFYRDLPIVFILKLFGKKIIYHFHNKGVAIAGKRKLNNFLYRYTFKNSLIILLSGYLYYDVEHYVNKENVFYCPNGIPGNEVNISLKSSINNSALPCRLLYLGNMMVEKGVYVLLEACKKLKERKLFFECHFVGGWSNISEEEFKERILQNDLSDVVFSHGPKYNEEKHAYFTSSDIFVFPTSYHHEVLPIVNLEAMQYGLPVVSTPEGGIRDEVIDGETGFLVPQNNAGALVEKLELLIQNPELRRHMGLKGAERFNELFTLNKFEQTFTAILKAAVNKNIS
ncbi:MAG: glycosyltransferase family 4 protein [Ginsengibacter sp.]